MAQVLIELNEGGVFRRKFVDADSVAVWAEAGWAVPPDTLADGQATGYDAIVRDLIGKDSSLTKAAIEDKVRAVGDATYAPQSLAGTTVLTLPAANGTDDTSVIQAALTAVRVAGGGHVKGRPGSAYKISAPIVQGSNTTLDLTAATLTLKSGSNCNMWQSYAAVNATQTATDAATTVASNVVTTALGASAAVGQSVVVTGAGGVLADASQGPLVGLVSAATSTTITLVKLDGVTAMPAVAAVTGGAIKLYNRDKNIQVIGGKWDRGANDGTALARHNLLARRIDGLKIGLEGFSSTAGKYVVSAGDVTAADISLGVLNAKSDGAHINGPARGVTIHHIYGTSEDDLASLTSADYNTYSDVQGDIDQVDISHVVGNSTTCILKFATSASCRIDGVSGTNLKHTKDGKVLSYANDCGLINIGTVRLSNLYGYADTFASTGSIGNLYVKGWSWTVPASHSTAPVFRILCSFDSVTIDDINLSSAYATFFVYVDNAGALTGGSIALRGGRIYGPGACGIRVEGASNTVRRISASDVALTGPSGGSILRTASSATVNQIHCVGGDVSGGSTWAVDIQGAGTPDVFLSRTTGPIHVGSTNSAYVRQADGGTTVTATGNTIDSGASVRAQSFDFKVDVSKLIKTNANDCAFNSNAALACGTGPVVTNGTSWKHIYTGATY
jgi:hypothetical protein